MKKIMATIIVTLFLASMIAFNVGSVQAVTIDIAPDTFNVYNTKGNYISAYIEPSIFFSDNFEDGNALGWTEVGSGGIWDVEYDTDFLSQVYSQEDTLWTTTSTYDTYWRSYGDTSWTDYIVEAKVKIVSGGFAPIAGIFFRVQGTDLTSGYYMFRIDARSGHGPALIKSPNTALAGGRPGNPQFTENPATIGQIYTLKVAVKGNNIKCYLDGSLTFDFTDVSNPYLTGRIGVGTFNAHTHFDDVIVTENFDVTTINVNTVKLWHAIFSDDFDDSDYNGWSPVTGDTSWSVTPDGKLHTDGSVAYPRILADATSAYEDYVFEADARVVSGRGYAMLFRAADDTNFYSFQYQVGAGVQLRLFQFVNFPSGADVASSLSYPTDNNWHHLKVKVVSNHIECYVDGDLVFDVTDTVGPAPLTGGIGFRTWASTVAEFDNVVVLSHIAGAEEEPTVIADYDNDMVPDREVKFDRAVVADYLVGIGITSGEVELVVTGDVNGADFAGSDSVRIIAKGKARA